LLVFFILKVEFDKVVSVVTAMVAVCPYGANLTFVGKFFERFPSEASKVHGLSPSQ
jgi:hypothetical protein